MVIDIVQTKGTVAGRIAVGDGVRTEFFGWLELIDRLECAAGTSTQEAPIELYAVLRRRGWPSGADLQATAACSARAGAGGPPDKVSWIRSYVLEEADGSVGTLCLYEAASAEAVRRHAQRADVRADEVIRVISTVVARNDPRPAAI